MPGPGLAAVEAARRRDANLTKPPGSLGRLEEIVVWLAAWQGQAPPAVNRPLVAIFAGNHGVAARGVSAFPPTVTAQMVENFAGGGAAINQICLANDLGLKVSISPWRCRPATSPARRRWTRSIAPRTMAFGMEAVAGGIDLLCIGEMGIGNTTIAAAIFAALFGGTAADWVGRGTGVDDRGLAASARWSRRRSPSTAATCDPLEVLRRLGGRELAAMAGRDPRGAPCTGSR